ncbi:uncharacterized protein BDV17DRAFT_49705 [Aspergillus undulatus]|uniref:uncharacterized protein n=1 Tax=Aspergillus undulatus TaxID=1810928 RepID=UPI003CCC9638
MRLQRGSRTVRNLFASGFGRQDTRLPRESWFNDQQSSEYICNKMAGAEESGIIELVGDLIVPRVDLAIYAGRVAKIEELMDMISVAWSHSVPFDDMSKCLPHFYVQNLDSTGYILPTPQPDQRWASTTRLSLDYRNPSSCPTWMTIIRFLKARKTCIFPS